MEQVTKEQFVKLRQRGYSPEDIKSIAARNRVFETLNKQTFKQKGLFRSAAEFLNMDEFGRGIGQTIANVSGAQTGAIEALEQGQQIQRQLEKKIREHRAKGIDTSRLEQTLKQHMETSGQTAEGVTELGTGGLSNREVLGSAISTGLNVASLTGSLPTAGTFGKASSIMGGVGRGAAAGAVSGAAFGGAEALTEGTGVAKGAVIGGAVGGAIGGVMGGVSKYIEDLSKVTPDSKLREMSSDTGFKQLKRKFEENSVYKKVDGKRVLVSDPISTLTKENVPLTVKDGKVDVVAAREQIRQLITEQDEEVVSAINKAVQSGNVAKTDSLREAAIAQVKNKSDLKARGVVTKTINEINKIFDDYALTYGDEIRIDDVSNIRVAMNKVFNADTVDAERAIGNAARGYLYQNAPGAQGALAREGQLIAADEFLDVLGGKTVKGGRLGKYFWQLTGAIAGGQAERGYLGSIVGAVGGDAISRFVQKQALNPVASQIARGLQSLPTDTAGNISKTAVLNLIGQLGGQSSDR